MYDYRGQYPYPYQMNMMPYNMYPYPFIPNPQMMNMYPNQFYNKLKRQPINLEDYGPQPIVVDLDSAAEQNNNFRLAFWTGTNMQVTLMSLNINEDIGLEVHQADDQFISIVEGRALVKMGNSQNNLSFEKVVSDDHIIIIPSGTWHNIINIGNEPVKLFSIYAPSAHPKSTIHITKQDAINAENNYSY